VDRTAILQSIREPLVARYGSDPSFITAIDEYRLSIRLESHFDIMFPTYEVWLDDNNEHIIFRTSDHTFSTKFPICDGTAFVAMQRTIRNIIKRMHGIEKLIKLIVGAGYRNGTQRTVSGYIGEQRAYYKSDIQLSMMKMILLEFGERFIRVDLKRVYFSRLKQPDTTYTCRMKYSGGGNVFKYIADFIGVPCTNTN